MSNLFGTGINQVPTNGMLGNLAFQDKAFLSVDKVGIGTTAVDTGTANQTLQNYGGAYISGSVGVGTVNPGVNLDVYRTTGGTAIRASSVNYKSDYNPGLISGIATNAAAAYAPQFAASAPYDIANGVIGVYSFYPTFSNFPSDKVPRRAVDIVGGFSTSTWGTEYFAINVGRDGVNNDAAILTNERMRVDGSGNVGIATTNPTSKLHIIGNALVSGVVTATTFVGNLTGTAGYATTAGISTNVIGGIGSISSLTVSGIATAAQLDLTASPTNNDPVLYITTAGAAPNNSRTGIFSIGTLVPTNFLDSGIVASFASSETNYTQMILQNTNNTPTASTDFIVNNNIAGASSNYGDFGINASGFTPTNPFGDPNGTYLYSSGGTLSIGSNDAFDFKIATGSAGGTPVTRLTITGTTGRTGIGTTLPVQPFQIGAGTTSVVVDSTGDVGIGTTNPQAKLHIIGGTTAAGTAPLEISKGSLLNTIESDVFEYDGTNLYHTANDTTNGFGRAVIPEIQFRRLVGSNIVGTASSSIFGVGIGSFSVLANTLYEFECNYYTTKTVAGTATFNFVLSAGVFSTLSGIVSPLTTGITGATGALVNGGALRGGTTGITTIATASLANATSYAGNIKLTFIPSANAKFDVRAIAGGASGTLTFLGDSYMKLVGYASTVSAGNVG